MNNIDFEKLQQLIDNEKKAAEKDKKLFRSQTQEDSLEDEQKSLAIEELEEELLNEEETTIGESKSKDNFDMLRALLNESKFDENELVNSMTEKSDSKKSDRSDTGSNTEVLQADTKEELEQFYNERQDEYLEGKIELEDDKWRDRNNIPLGNSDLSFDELFKKKVAEERERVELPKKKKTKPSSKKDKNKDKNKTINNEKRVVKSINKPYHTLNTYTDENTRIPVRVPERSDFEGVLPEDRRPVLSNTIADINRDTNIGTRTPDIFSSLEKSYAIDNKEDLLIEDDSFDLAQDTVIDSKGTTLAEFLGIQGETKEKKKETYINNKSLKQIRNSTNRNIRLLGDLNITGAALSSLVKPNGELSDGFKEKYYGKENVSRGSLIRETIVEGNERFKIVTDEWDRDIIAFLGKFKMASTSILSNLNYDWTYQITEGRCLKLKEYGLLQVRLLPGSGSLWSLDSKGRAFAEQMNRPVSKYNLPKFGSIPALFAANHVASLLWNNTQNVLNLDDFPYHGKLVNDQYIRGETLISETEIRSSISQIMFLLMQQDYGADVPVKRPKGYYGKRIGQHAMETWARWEVNGGESPEMIKGNEFLWSLYPQYSGSSRTYHNPDLIIVRERNEDGTPNHIAVEVERKPATAEYYEDIMRTYKEDKYLYCTVIWVAENASIARNIMEGARLAGNKNYDIVPFIGKNGPIDTKDMWFL